MSSFKKVDTKKEAFKLVHDPTRLLSLLYSKYGDIDEDYGLLYSNQLVYNKSTHLNIIFKEFQFINNNDEFLKRFYKINEVKPRIPRLNEYYKNYSKFFCRPIFCEQTICDLMHGYNEKKAEDFYKNNYSHMADDINKFIVMTTANAHRYCMINKHKNLYNSKKMIDRYNNAKSIYKKNKKEILKQISFRKGLLLVLLYNFRKLSYLIGRII